MNVSINSPSVSTWPPLSSNYTPYVPMNATGLTQKNRGLQREFVNQTAQVKQTGVQILTNTVKDFFAGVQKGVSNYVFSWFSNDETTAPPLDANASAQQKHQYRQEKRRLEASHKRKNEGPTPSFITSPTAASSRTPSFDPSLPMVSESEKKNNFQFSTTQKSKSQRQTKASLNAKTEGSLNRKMPVTQKEKKQINPVTQINKNTAKIEPKKSMTPQEMDFKIMKASHLRLITKHRVWLTYMEEKMRLENARIPLEIQRCLRDENTHTQQKIDALTAQLLSLETKYEKENKALDQTFELTKKKIENLFLIEKLTSHSSLSENNESIDCKERREMFKTVNTFSVKNNEAINAIFQKGRDKLLQDIQRGQNTSLELSLDQEKHIEAIKISSGRLEQLEQLERKFNDDLKAQRVLIKTMKEPIEQACHLTKNKHFKFSKITDICDVAANRFDVDCSKKHMCKDKIESLTYQMRIKRLIEIAKENQEEILSKNTNKALHVLFDTLQEDELDDNEVLDEIYRRSKLDDTYLVSDLRDWNEDLLDQLFDQCILGDRDISDSILSLLQTEKYTCKNIKVSVERFGAFERAVDKILQLINAQEEKVISEEINNIDTEIYIARAKRKGFENKYQEHDDYNSKRWTMLKNQIYKLFENSVKKKKLIIHAYDNLLMTQEKCDQDYERNRLYEKEEINIRLKEGEKSAHQNEPLGLYIAFPLSFLFLTSSLFVLSKNVKKLSKPESLFIEMERKETLNTDGAKKVNKELLSLRSKISKEPRRECPISFPSLSELTQEEYDEIPTEEYSRYLDKLHRLQRKQRKEVSRSKRTEIFNKYKNSSLNNSDDNVLVEYDTASFAKSYERTSRFEGASLSINNESTLLKSILKPSNVKRSKKSKKSKELKKVSFNKEDEIKLFYTCILPKF